MFGQAVLAESPEAKMESNDREFETLAKVINDVWFKSYGGPPVTDANALAVRVAALGADRVCWVQNASALQSEYLRIDAQLRGSPPPPPRDLTKEIGARAIEAQPGKSYMGEVVGAAVPGRVLQNIGQNTLVSHELGRLDALLWSGLKVQIKYDADGRGKVTLQREHLKEAALTR